MLFVQYNQNTKKTTSVQCVALQITFSRSYCCRHHTVVSLSVCLSVCLSVTLCTVAMQQKQQKMPEQMNGNCHQEDDFTTTFNSYTDAILQTL